MSEEKPNLPLGEVAGEEASLQAELSELNAKEEALSKENAALSIELSKKQSEVISRLKEEAKKDIELLNRECAELTKREIAVMDDFSAALLSLNDAVCDLQAVLEMEQSKDRESEEGK